MRVITGEARGRRLKTLAGDDVRPTGERVKEAVFSIIHFDIEGRSVLDLFAGCGQMGIEALSRGARKCVFVDISKRSLGVVRENVQNCRMTERAQLVQADAVSYAASCAEKFDIAFLDPPYSQGLLPKTLPLLSAKMNKGGVMICESPAGAELPEKAGCFTKRRSYRYGRTFITIYRHEEVD